MVRSAHPRSRGENPASPGQDDGTIGSSPLTRGKPAATLGELGGVRLIPAHAGKTGLAAAVDRLRAAHPRSRGENQSTRRPALLQRGSSPLTRGKPRLLQAGGLLRRLIPAHAGKTVGGTDTTLENPAHPRSRGENRFSPPDWPLVSGSSPLTRGKHQDLGYRCDGLRLIPAHAGKTDSRSLAIFDTPAHPRSRGENLDSANPHFRTRGSSPLTRGKPRPQAWRLYARRLIPAHAGKTFKGA